MEKKGAWEPELMVKGRWSTLWATIDRTSVEYYAYDWSEYQDLTLGSNASIATRYHATYTHPLHHRRSMLQLSSVLSICLAHRSQSSTYPSSMGRGRKKNQPNEGPCARQLLARRATNILNKGQWTTRCCMNSPRWMCFNWIFLSPSSFNVQVSYLERRCIYSRCAFPPNMKLGYWKLKEQWTTTSCTS